MKKLFAIQSFMFLLLFGTALAESLSEQYQQDILDRMSFLRGDGPRPASLDSGEIPHCGTGAAFELFINLPNMTEPYLQAAKAMARPILPLSYTSPAARYLIHYTISGSDAVYQSGVDVSPADGVPDYVNKVGEIADSVYQFEIIRLGFPAPPNDDTAGGNALYDIYIYDLGYSYYGYTQGETAVSSQSATSYLVIDNDYNFAPYSARPLDAARVTVAHEFFHAIHFGMDYTEYEGANTFDDPARLYWWEMSATWMEEMAYDGINDYYGYLKSYYDYPWLALQFFEGNSLHPYGAAVFPLFLSEKFDTVIVREIWERCRDYGQGAQFLQAANDAIEASPVIIGDDTVYYDLGRAFSEFSVWNLFTGPRAVRAPAGYQYIIDTVIDTVVASIGFSEAASYPMIPDSAFIPHSTYPFRMVWPWPSSTPEITASKMAYYKARVPQNLGANYIALSNLGASADTLIFRFAGFRNDPLQLTWHSALVGLPINPSTPADVRIYKQLPTAIIADSIFTTGYFRYYGIPVVTSPLNSAYIDGGNGHPYGYLVLDTLQVDTTAVDSNLYFSISAPYPNPMVVKSEDDAITFKIDFADTAGIPFGTKIDVSVDIFNVAGEKVFSPDLRDSLAGDFAWPIYRESWEWSWNLTNSKANPVAPGVYVAILRLMIPDMQIETVKKYKLAVIR